MKTELLQKLYGIFSPSGNTKKMRRFLKSEIAKRGATVEQDKMGNLLVTKGEATEYPCLASHIDQVKYHTHPKDFRCIETDGIILGWSDKLLQQCGLGADDKNGIFICLNALEKFDTLKVAFFVDEEVGCLGSEKIDISFFNNVRFVIEPDRMNGNNLITCMSGVQVCSEDFIKDCGYAEFGYSFDEGSLTDVLTLLERGIQVSCLNLSCGYYHPHTDQEVTVLSELENCQDFVFHMIEGMQRVYPFEYSLATQDSLNATYWDYDNDYDVMEDILSSDPTMTFDDIVNNYGEMFLQKDKAALHDVYDDIIWFESNYTEKD